MVLTPYVPWLEFGWETPQNVPQSYANARGVYPPIVYYLDQHNWQWKQLPDGRWLRNKQYLLPMDYTGYEGIADNWVEDDPNRTTDFDVSVYSWFRWYVDGMLARSNGGESVINPDYNDPWLFDDMLATGYRYSGANVNPYFVTQIRDAMRDLAVRMGLPAWYADRAAMQFAESTLIGNRQYYSEATSPAIVADEIIIRLNALSPNWKAPTLSPEQRASATFSAANLQDNIKSHRETAEDAADWAQGAQIIAVFAAPVAALIGTAVAAVADAAATTAAASAEAAAASTMAVETSGAAAFSSAPEISVFGDAADLATGASAGWEGFGNFAYKFLEQTYQAYKGGAFTTAQPTARNAPTSTTLRIPIAAVDDVASKPEIRQAVSLIGLTLLLQELTK